MLTALVWHVGMQIMCCDATIDLFLIHTWCYWGVSGSGGEVGRPLVKRLVVSISRSPRLLVKVSLGRILKLKFLPMSRLALCSVVCVWVRQVFKSSLSTQQTGEALHKHESIYHSWCVIYSLSFSVRETCGSFMDPLGAEIDSPVTAHISPRVHQVGTYVKQNQITLTSTFPLKPSKSHLLFHPVLSLLL